MYLVNNLYFSNPNHLGKTCFLDFNNSYALHICKIENEDLSHYYHITFMKKIDYRTYSSEIDQLLNTITSEIEKDVYSDTQLQTYIDSISNINFINQNFPEPTPTV